MFAVGLFAFVFPALVFFVLLLFFLFGLFAFVFPVCVVTSLWMH